MTTRYGREREDERSPGPAAEEADEVDEDDLVRTEDGELIDEESGLVVEEDNVDRGPEWRAFDATERDEKSRVGSPMTQTMHDKGLTTSIDWRNRDAGGSQLSAEKRSQVQRLRTWQERIRTQDAGERNLQLALSEVDRMSSAQGVPKSVREVASVIYRRALSEDLIRGRSIEAMATASLYAACRQEGIPRSLDDFVGVARVERREIARAYRYISGELSLELRPVDPAEHVPRFCSELDLSDDVVRRAKAIVEETTAQGLHAGKSPTGFAAAAIYLASMLSNDKRTQSEIADVADVTVVTVRNRYKEQMNALDVGDL
ncbi:transcription initiation factor IIB [Candidatus Halobonum tyrrellensis]|uniref:Transcription initiation factor IIB n=1 Tax=Candidatus Halobonum tyrrellensis G22 TaxID=1324957 RepID=V4HHM3_9EURY|nr:transcription initiation factor IIB [Candidatus Halobonum tyrrellensis]ESP87379.1 transcription initiation factor TFB [Candidatus Halobonum tyrrellensis G22]